MEQFSACDPADVLECCGFKPSIIISYARLYGINQSQICELAAAFAMMHMNLSDKALPVVVRGLFGVTYPTTTLIRSVMAIMEKVYALPKLNRWGHRFAVVDPTWATRR